MTITSPKPAATGFFQTLLNAVAKPAGTAALALGIALSGILATTPAHAASDQKAIKFVEDLGAEAIGVISDKSVGKQAMEDKFQTLLQKNADLRKIAAFSLGRYVRTPNDAQKTEYLKLFETFIVKVYVTRLSDYNDEKFDVTGAQEKGSKGREVIVSSQIRFTNGRQPVDVKWWLLREDDGFKVFDVNVAGIWLAQEQRDQFTSILNSNNGNFPALLDHLKTKIGQAEKGQVNAAMSDGKNNAN
ncbi:MlaC/ttg2D family ABC transporter substrate-binding protein [Parvibaculum sp. MBR-TMA-1.3b-4.2]|jgi:phospholipid transport system substrate-binding protein